MWGWGWWWAGEVRTERKRIKKMLDRKAKKRKDEQDGSERGTKAVGKVGREG